MAMFWLLVGLGIIAAAVAAGLIFVGIRENRGSSYDEGLGWFVTGALFACVPVTLGLLLAVTAVHRDIAETSCAKKNTLTGDRYQWVDYHFFGYECSLRTPSGNLTETPVLPLEDVTQR
jgi:hypothetical protein